MSDDSHLALPPHPSGASQTILRLVHAHGEFQASVAVTQIFKNSCGDAAAESTLQKLSNDLGIKSTET